MHRVKASQYQDVIQHGGLAITRLQLASKFTRTPLTGYNVQCSLLCTTPGCREAAKLESSVLHKNALQLPPSKLRAIELHTCNCYDWNVHCTCYIFITSKETMI